MTNSKQYIDASQRQQLKHRNCVGVVGGDPSCMRALAHHWTGRSAINVFLSHEHLVELADFKHKQELIFLLDVKTQITPWPNGPLIWLYPERGPSESELAQLRLALRTNKTSSPQLLILVCLPDDVDTVEAGSVLDNISETIRWTIDPNVVIELESVWLSNNLPNSLSHWLMKLR